MGWFVVSFVDVCENIDGGQELYPVDEDIVLYHADSQDELDSHIQNTILVCNSAGADGIRYYERPARVYYIGTRQIKLLNDKPKDCTWVYHSEMSVKTLEEAELLVQGKAVDVCFLDVNDMENES